MYVWSFFKKIKLVEEDISVVTGVDWMPWPCLSLFYDTYFILAVLKEAS